jgi:hypothetical protein
MGNFPTSLHPDCDISGGQYLVQSGIKLPWLCAPSATGRPLDDASYEYYSVVLLHGTKYVEATKFPFATLGDEYSRRSDVSMDRSCVVVYESDNFLGQLLKHCAFAAAATYGDAMQAPFYGLLGHALPLDLPRCRGKSFSGNVDVLFGLVATVNSGISPVAAATNLKSVKDLDQTRVSEGPEFAECIAGERELGTVSGNIEGEDAALGAIFLYRPTVSGEVQCEGDHTRFVPL